MEKMREREQVRRLISSLLLTQGGRRITQLDDDPAHAGSMEVPLCGLRQ